MKYSFRAAAVDKNNRLMEVVIKVRAADVESAAQIVRDAIINHKLGYKRIALIHADEPPTCEG
jgi:hypothetical protein